MENGSANYWAASYGGNTYYTTEVGAYIEKPSDSAYGTFDQGGNLREWNEDARGSARCLRGGNWSTSYSWLHAYWWEGYSPTVEYRNIGFRVASIPEPSSILLLLLGLLGLLAYPWRKRHAGCPIC